MIKTAVIGVGHLGRHHARLYKAMPNAELIAVVDSDSQRGQAIADEYQTAFTDDFHTILSAVDAVSVAVPTTLHHSITKVILEHGIHVLLEKPIASSLPEADELIALARRHNLVLQIGHLERFNPAVIAVQGQIRKPLFIESHRIGPFSNRGTDVDVIVDLMIHDLDLLLHFVQSPIADLHAVGVPVLSDQVDIANCRIQFETGCVANITASRASMEPLRKMRIFQADSYISMDFAKRTSEMYVRDRATPFDFTNPMTSIRAVRLAVNQAEPLKAEIEAFLACVESRSQPLIDGVAARAALKLALDIRRVLQSAPLP